MSKVSKEIRELEEIPAIPRPDLYEMIRDAPVRDGELMASWTLLANRCSEGLAVTPADVHKEVSIDVFKLEINELAAKLGRARTEVDIGGSLGRDVSQAKEQMATLYDKYLNMTSLEEMYHNPISKEAATDDIMSRYPETLVYVVTLYTLKRTKRIGPEYTDKATVDRLVMEKGWTIRKIRSRDKSNVDRWRRVLPHRVPRLIPIPTIDPLAPLLVSAIKKMRSSFFGISRQRVWQLFKRAGIYAFYKDDGYPVPKNPLRHLRLSEIANVMNEAQRYRYAGWKMKGTQDKYIHLKWDDFIVPLVTLGRKAPPLNL